MIRTILILILTQTLVLANLWIHVDVKKIERKPCTVDETSWGAETVGCSQMTYMTLDERILPNHERRSTSFEHIEGVSRPTVTHWPNGKLSDWMVSMQFISVDPVYGIARTCDRSGFVRVFHGELNEMATIQEKTIQIQGQCFTATVQIKASAEICPWCVEDEGSSPTTTTSSPKMSPSALSSSVDSPFLLVVMLSLTIISVVALFGTGILLIFYISDRRRHEKALSTTTKSIMPVFELPEPAVASRMGHRKVSSTCSTWATRSSGDIEEQWGEYPTERWESYHPAAVSSPNIYCNSPDSGRDSV